MLLRILGKDAFLGGGDLAREAGMEIGKSYTLRHDEMLLHGKQPYITRVYLLTN